MPSHIQAGRALRPPRRGPLRAFLETRGVVGRHTRPHLETRLRAADGVALAATYLPGPGLDAPAVVLAHGFAAHRRKPAYARLADVLSDQASVLALDLRGHGRSRGASTLGDREALDVEAAVGWLRAMGHHWVALLGVSMGATAVLHAGARAGGIDAVVAVSAPARLHDTPRSAPMARLHDVWHSPWKRAGLRYVVGVHVVPPTGWTPPPHPADAATAIDVPVLIAHGLDDHFFPWADALELGTAVAGPATVWLEPAGFGHAEDGLSAPFCTALASAVAEVRRTGAFPERGARP